ncbi:SDR family oxidoreductase [Amaricoccus sp.]|uniref:SDR family NAD(P)-dependent oxidoreductase n=1 Tax=Amaricoccus sp. TaxID=1872485 RepID=UPI0026350AA2|nr:SDR family oxidoreductase [uncultured Amaricoccus sp.]
MTAASDTPKPVVAVTGASRGIGHAIVRQFYARGWDVITLARTPFSTVCPWAEGIVKHIEVNLSDLDSVRAAAAALRGQLDQRGLSALVNNAGISPKTPGGGRMDAISTPVDTFYDVTTVNLIAPLVLCQELIEPLKTAKGAIVNISSIAGSRVHPFAGAAYAASKAALSALTRELAHDLAPFGVRVNAVAPGEIATDILSPGTERIVEEQVPMRRLGRPEEVAEVVAFLAGRQSSYVTGSEIPINGGQHI